MLLLQTIILLKLDDNFSWRTLAERQVCCSLKEGFCTVHTIVIMLFDAHLLIVGSRFYNMCKGNYYFSVDVEDKTS